MKTVVITGGTTQAINIACHLLLGDRRQVVIENPLTRDIRLIIEQHQGEVARRHRAGLR